MDRTRIDDLTALHVAPAAEPHRGPLVFVHGLWAAAWTFEGWLDPAAARGWDAWAPNLRGREGSRPVADLGRVSLQDFAQDVADVLTETGPAVVVGYSMGGLLTQIVMSAPATRHLVRGAVLLCSLPPRGISAVSAPMLRSSVRYLPAMARSRAWMPDRADSEAMVMNGLDPADRDVWFPRWLPDAGRVSRQVALGAVRVDPDLVGCPVLVVSAERDRISPPSIQPKLAKRYRAEHLAFAGRAHLLAIEPGWEEAEARILDRVEGWSLP